MAVPRMATTTMSLCLPAAALIDGVESGRNRDGHQGGHDRPAEHPAGSRRADPKMAVFEQQPHPEQAGDG